MSQALAVAARGAEERPRRCRLRFPLLAAVVALSAAPAATGSNVPVAETAPCPPGYYRRAVLVFACGQQDGEVYFPLANVSKTAVGIPKGIRNLKLTLDASGPVDVLIVDPATNTTVANSTAALGATATWNDVAIAFTSGPSSGGTKEGVSFTGTLPSTLSVKLANRLTSENLAAITYSYDDFEGCPEVPVGCAKYDQAAARELVFNWSTWVSTQYPKAASAWQALASQAMKVQYGSSARAGPIPFHLWHGVWKKWPGAAKAAARGLDWQAAFKFIDSLHTEDQLVEVVEFIRAYKIAGIGLSMFNWCTALRTQYPDAQTAWLAVAGPTSIAGIDYSRWKTAVWPSFTPPDDFAKASSAGSFQYADASQNGVVSSSELAAVYNSCDYRPETYATTTTATTAATASTPSTSAAAASTTISAASTSSSMTTTIAGLAATANASNASTQENSTVSVQAASASVTVTSTMVSTTTASSNSSMSKSECCGQAHAECLACEAGQSTLDFCKSSLGVGVEGCQVTEALIDDHEANMTVQPDSPLWRAAPQPDPAPEVQSAETEVKDCPYPGVSYAPALEDHNQTAEGSVVDCQARCAETAGCAFFSFRSTSGACNVHGPSAVWSLTVEEGAVAGPSLCVAKLGVHISNVDFKALSDSQKRSALRFVVQDIANSTGLPHQAVKDLSGNPASVTLSAGSLVVGASLELPPGWSKSNTSAQLASEAFADRLRASMGEVGVRSSEVADHPIHGRHAVDVNVEVSHDCFLRGTRFGAPGESGNVSRALASTEHVKAANASTCQAACLKAQACDFFTFVPSMGACLFRGGSAVAAISDQGAVSGPRQCAGLPVVPRTWASKDDLASVPGQAGFGQLSVWWLLLGASVGAILLGGVALALLTQRGKRRRGGKVGDYAPLSRQEVEDEEDGEASQSADSGEEDNGNRWLSVGKHPLSMDPADDGDGNEDAERGTGHAGPAGYSTREPQSLTVSSRELRGPAAGEAGSNLMTGFLGTEALRK